MENCQEYYVLVGKKTFILDFDKENVACQSVRRYWYIPFLAYREYKNGDIIQEDGELVLNRYPIKQACIAGWGDNYSVVKVTGYFEDGFLTPRLVITDIYDDTVETSCGLQRFAEQILELSNEHVQ